ncbi:MAG TPA: cysteine--1-D-myo-inosityl 2-amino-2-deoxy-alpha-D-glucopyranoside ligase [Candidatus Limnocylindrales bacterium]
MRSWRRPVVPRLPGQGAVPRIYDTATRRLVEARPIDVAGLYVCGITPYDATHIGHAATYLAYDTLIRLWLDAGYRVRYVQNTTDVDDPLLERAAATGVDWRTLAAEQTELFRRDMESLGVIPPDHYVAATEVIEQVADAVRRLLDRGTAYRVDEDIYFDIAAAADSSPWHLGQESNLDRLTMLELSAERGGDPERPGKRDVLDPLLWRGARAGEPSWETVLGVGRPGWHIECSVIAQEFLDLPLTVNGGGSDLVFPHHEFSAGHTAALTGRPLANLYSHTGLVAYRGEKMSKSLGNLVLVSTLIDSGVDARAIRLAVLSQHYRDDWEWTDDLLAEAQVRLVRWSAWASGGHSARPTSILEGMRVALVHDLDTPTALAAVDALAARGPAPAEGDLAAIDALLGIRL